ncbi:MAG: hypothetical protein VR64_22615 [Desulfatitalea sp. BRH_c12]|nr:MAG: hypothetical protein VR64_22615 [Desulfatitalea sp. BRH_c12]
MAYEMHIVLLSTDRELITSINHLLATLPFRVTTIDALGGLAHAISEHEYATVMIDLSCVPVDNRDIKDLRHRLPATHFIIISNSHFHPQLQEAIQQSIYACMVKPLDPDELLYLLRGIQGECPGNPPKSPE